MENRSLNIIVLMAVVAVGLVANADAKCGECLPNGIACANETSFHICYGPNLDQVFDAVTLTCPNDQVCTGLKIICAPGDQVDPACQDTLGCGVCSDLGGFTCLSKTKFALCVGGQVTAVQGTCPVGSICEAGTSTAGVCVDQCTGTPSCNKD